MKEIELDKYVGCTVKVVDFENDINIGVLYKVVDHSIEGKTQIGACAINKGYLLECPSKSICYRQSHIKKIKKVSL